MMGSPGAAGCLWGINLDGTHSRAADIQPVALLSGCTNSGAGRASLFRRSAESGHHPSPSQSSTAGRDMFASRFPKGGDFILGLTIGHCQRSHQLASVAQR